MPFNVLVLCTGNSARSILGEMLFNHLGKERVKAYSAGSRPAGQVNPVALEALQRHGVPCVGARSKSWDEFAQGGVSSRLTFDFIFTVCGNAARETCPVWPGHPATIRWGIPDPACIEPLEARREAFEETHEQLEKRIRAFLALPLETMGRQEVAAAARCIHEGG
ncbi:MAG: arsenate reductase ArsC [Sulfuritalea sp.]|nr:arsenate reductase ArsC [Sulfuritalea sp.]